MFEITFTDKDLLAKMVSSKKALLGAVYDFTYENRFLVYHAEIQSCLAYNVLDITTGYASRIINRKIGQEYKPNELGRLIPLMFKSLKYIGNVKQDSGFRLKPYEAIEEIMRKVLPINGYDISESQIALCRCIFRCLTTTKLTFGATSIGRAAIVPYIVAGYVARKYRISEYYNEKAVIIVADKRLHTEFMKTVADISSVLYGIGIIDKPLKAVIRKRKESYICLRRYLRFDDKKILEGKVTVEMLCRGPVDMEKLNLPGYAFKKLSVGSSCRECNERKRCGFRKFISTVNEDESITFQVMTHRFYVKTLSSAYSETNSVSPFGGFVIIDDRDKLYREAEIVFSDKLVEKDIRRCIYDAVCKTDSDKKLIRDAEETADRFFEAIEDIARDSEDGYIIFDADAVRITDRLIRIFERLRYNEVKNPVAEFRNKKVHEKLKKLKCSNRVEIRADKHNHSMSVYLSPKDLDAEMMRTLWSKDVSHMVIEHTEEKRRE